VCVCVCVVCVCVCMMYVCCMHACMYTGGGLPHPPEPVGAAVPLGHAERERLTAYVYLHWGQSAWLHLTLQLQGLQSALFVSGLSSRGQTLANQLQEHTSPSTATLDSRSPAHTMTHDAPAQGIVV